MTRSGVVVLCDQLSFCIISSISSLCLVVVVLELTYGGLGANDYRGGWWGIYTTDQTAIMFAAMAYRNGKYSRFSWLGFKS